MGLTPCVESSVPLTKTGVIPARCASACAASYDPAHRAESCLGPGLCRPKRLRPRDHLRLLRSPPAGEVPLRGRRDPSRQVAGDGVRRACCQARPAFCCHAAALFSACPSARQRRRKLSRRVPCSICSIKLLSRLAGAARAYHIHRCDAERITLSPASPRRELSRRGGA